MDAGVCSACQHPLGEFNTDNMLGLFPRVRCGACGFVNVLADSAAAATEAPAAPRSETLAIDVSAFQEQPSIEQPPSFDPEGEESPGYEDNADYEQPAEMAPPSEEGYGDQEVPELPSEPTRVGSMPEENEE